MFATIKAKTKKHGTTIALTIGALLAVGLGATYLFPAQVAGALAATGNFFSRIGTAVVGMFKRGSESVAAIEPIVDQNAPVPEVVMPAVA